MRRGALGVFVGVSLLLFASGLASSASSTGHEKPRWRATVATLPANSALGKEKAVNLISISCPSTGNCSAVGSYARNRKGLLLTEKAGRWTRGVEAVLPANANPSLGVLFTSVSCVSAGNCTAVGTYYTGLGGIYEDGGREGLLLTEKAGHWARGVEAVLPADAASDPVVTLSAVSCASAGNCTAVGSYDNYSGGIYAEGGSAGLLLTEKAGHWAAGVEPPLPSDAKGSSAALSSVSCSPNGSCSAVGTYNYSEGRVAAAGEGLLLTKKRGTWQAVKAVMPPDGPGEGVILTSVSCAAAGNCGAIGVYNINIDKERAPEGVLLNEKAGKWHPGVMARPPKNATDPFWGQYVGLVGISCASPNDCVAIGRYSGGGYPDRPTLLTEEAGHWARGIKVVFPAYAASPPELSVSCASAGNCTAAGSYNGGGIRRGFLWTETAGSWARGVKAPRPTHWVFSVSCAAAGNCGAVGSDLRGHGVLLDSSTKPCVVPRLKGKAVSAARHSIDSHGCAVGRIAHARSRTIETGHVISQKPQPGSRLAPWGKVRLTVGNGP
jgi:PASTA domain-containing protein